MPKEDKKSNSGNRSVDLTPDALISALEAKVAMTEKFENVRLPYSPASSPMTTTLIESACIRTTNSYLLSLSHGRM